MKVIVIGCTHAGTAAILNVRKLYPEAEVTVYERNDNISFLSCGIALFVGGIVQDAQGLFYCSPEKLAELGVRTRMRHDVASVDVKARKMQVRDMETGRTFEDSYDKLIVTTGSWPVDPPIPGKELGGILLCKNYDHAKKIIETAQAAKKVVVVGAGYIGVELVEAFQTNGKKVTLIDSEPRILNRYLDPEFTSVAEKSLRDNGITLALGQCVSKFEGKDGKVSNVVTDKGSYDADMVILCIGFRPNTDLFKGQLNMLPKGALVVDPYMRTSHPDVLAAGDCCGVLYNPTGEQTYMPLATNAVRMGTLAAYNLLEGRIKSPGTQGTSGIKIYEDNIASTGVTEREAERLGRTVRTVTVTEPYRPAFMPTHEDVTLKVVYEEDSRRIVGAQLMSKHDVTLAINALSIAMQGNMTMTDLAFVDCFFQPHYNNPWSFLNKAGLASL